MVDNVGRLILRLANTSFLSTDIKKLSKLLESKRYKVHESFYFTVISYLQPEKFKISCQIASLLFEVLLQGFVWAHQ